MSEDEFVKRWCFYMAGMATYGYISEMKDGPMKRGEKHLGLREEVEGTLRKMYRDARKPEARPEVNGHATPLPARKA